MKYSKIRFTSILFILLSIQNLYAYNAIVDEGWNLTSCQSSDWKINSGSGTLSVIGNGMNASIAKDCTAEWIITTEPIWIYRYSEITIRYRAKNLTNHENLPVIKIKNGSIGPVTPGATNLENPMSRAGTVRLLYDSTLICDGEIHEITAGVYPAIRTEQIDQITLCLQSDNKEGFIDIEELTFRIPPSEKKNNLLSTEHVKNGQSRNSSLEFNPITLPETDLTINDIAEYTSVVTETISCFGIPFQWNQKRSVLYTPFRAYGKLSIPVNRKTSEAFLLMGMNMAGTDWDFGFSPRISINQPERLMITKQYDDGSIEKSFPYQISGKAYIVESTMNVYMIPANPAKVLTSIQIEEKMSYCQIFLAGVTTLLSATPCVSIVEPVYPKTFPLPEIELSEKPVAAVEKKTGLYQIENDLYCMELSTKPGVELNSLFYKPSQKNILHGTAPIFILKGNTQSLYSNQCQIESLQQHGNQFDLILQSSNHKIPVQVALQIICDSSSQIRMNLGVQNIGDAKLPLQVSFPCLAGATLSKNLNDDFYFFPMRQVVWGNTPVTLKATHSGEFPLQFMDIYSETEQFGLALHTRETRLNPEEFRLVKGNTGSGMSIEYGFDNPIQLQPGQTFSAPESIIQIHKGDWQVPFESYKQWATKEFTPKTNARHVVKDVFICRRDYPLGGTGYLFDIPKNQYTVDNLIQECKEDLGGVDMLDISGWAYSEQCGRVGEYERFELAGAENLRTNIVKSHDHKIPVGLYLEGYLIDPRSTVGRQSAKEWQMLNADGTPRQWTGNQELFMCPYCKPWQEWMSNTLLHVANKTGADAFYLDQYGFADKAKSCFSTEHGHEKGSHPLAGEHQMIMSVRESLAKADHPVALYMEQVPNDITAQYVDAAFDYSMFGIKTRSNPTKMNLFRYAFPSFKIIELFHGGIDPKCISEEDVKICFFHGYGFWLKGRAKSWYSESCRDFIRKAYRIFHEHSDAFTSENIIPQIPTEQRGIYANRFCGEDEDIITIYNAANQSIDGSLLLIDEKVDSVSDLWGIPNFRYEKTSDGLHLSGFMEPDGIACFSLMK